MRDQCRGDGTIKLWVWDFDRLIEMGCHWIEPYLITRPEERDRCEGYLPPAFQKN
jgi:hypothetical protein